MHLTQIHCQLDIETLSRTLTCCQARSTGWLRLINARVTGWPRLICTMLWIWTQQKHTHVTSLILRYTYGTMVLPVYYSSPGHMKIRMAAHFLKFCILLLEILTEIFEIWHQKILCLFVFYHIEIFLGSRNILHRFIFSDQLPVKIISAQSKLIRLCSIQLTRWNCIGRVAKWPHLLTGSNCSHSECVHIIWCQTRKDLY